MRNNTVVHVVTVEVNAQGEEVEKIVETFNGLDGTNTAMVCLKAKERAEELNKNTLGIHYFTSRVD
jgi:predicted TIM-barrel fold metal-dependent hydrolase